jgi:DNA-binding XRE family transcriptional regulator
MNARKLGLNQAKAASIAEISERTGQRIEAGESHPNRGQAAAIVNGQDPLEEVWEKELEPMLKKDSRLKPMTLFEYLQETYPGKYPQVLRTLQRRVQTWKALHGPSPEVMFPLRHEPGMMGLSDFTQLKEITVTIAGQPLEHLLYHYRLAYSGVPLTILRKPQNTRSTPGSTHTLFKAERASLLYRKACRMPSWPVVESPNSIAQTV